MAPALLLQFTPAKRGREALVKLTFFFFFFFFFSIISVPFLFSPSAFRFSVAYFFERYLSTKAPRLQAKTNEVFLRDPPLLCRSRVKLMTKGSLNGPNLSPLVLYWGELSKNNISKKKKKHTHTHTHTHTQRYCGWKLIWIRWEDRNHSHICMLDMKLELRDVSAA